jgi:hypothetical protein
MLLRTVYRSLLPLLPDIAQRSVQRTVRQFILFYRAIRWPFERWKRLKFAMAYIRPQIDFAKSWAKSDSENSNFLYALTPISRLNLAHTLAAIFNVSPDKVRGLFAEIEEDSVFQNHVEQGLKRVIPGASSFSIGRRLGWYVTCRLLKPRTVVETGVDYGLGCCVICAALLRNAKEGQPGTYVGTDIRTEAGELLSSPYSSVGKILYGDSLTSLADLNGPIDVFINDSDHSPNYEAKEYEVIKDKLSPEGVILGDNSHCSPSLANFSEQNGRRFIFFKEEPSQHWYPGAGIGFSFIERNG